MNVQKLLFGILALSGMVFVGHLVMTSQVEVPPNTRVNELNFERLNVGMTEPQVEALLGFPHSTAGGEIMKVEDVFNPEAEFALGEQPRSAGGNVLNFYRGPDDECIRVLFSGHDRTLIGAEYRVCERAVIYRGTKPAGNRSAPVFWATADRGVDLEADAKVKSFLRRRALRIKGAAEAAVPRYTQVPPPAPAPAPAPPSAPVEPAPSEPPPAEAMPEPQVANEAVQPVGPDELAAREAAAREAELRVVLPSGMKLSKAMLDLPPNWSDEMFPSDASVFVANFPNGAVQGVFSLRESRLHGAAVTLYEHGKLATVAFYWEGDRNGPLRLWKENHQRLLYAEFKNSAKNGLLCYFRDGKPHVLQQWDKNRLLAQYLVVAIGDERRAVPEAELGEPAKLELAKVVAELADLDSKLKANETQLKRDLAAWYRKLDQQAKQARLATRRVGAPNPAIHGSSHAPMWRTALQESGL